MSDPRDLVPEILDALIDCAPQTVDEMRSGDSSPDDRPLADASPDEVRAAVGLAWDEGLVEEDPHLAPRPPDGAAPSARRLRLTPAGEAAWRALGRDAGVVVPRWIARAAERALADLQHPTALDLILTWREDDESELTLTVEEAGRPESAVMCLMGSPIRTEPLVAFLAEWLQDEVFHEGVGAWGEARPTCPGHPHPALAELVDDRAVWTCPTDGRVLRRIGEGVG